MSINHPWTIRFCRSAHFVKLQDKTEFTPWYGMRIDLKNGTMLESAALVTVFIPGDLIKAVLAGFITSGLAKARPASVLSRS